MSDTEFTQPSRETKLRMVEFFMRTSVPRILAEEKADKKVGEVVDDRDLDSEKDNNL